MATSPHIYTGVSVRYGRGGSDGYGWAASVAYIDSGFCSGHTAGGPISTEGTLGTRYYVTADGDELAALGAAVRGIIADATRFGIDWAPTRVDPDTVVPTLYPDGEGWGEEWDPDAPITQPQAREIVAEFARTWAESGDAPPATFLETQGDTLARLAKVADDETLDLDTRTRGHEPPFEAWEGDHTAFVHVLWSAKNRDLTLTDDADQIAEMLLRSRALATQKAYARAEGTKHAAHYFRDMSQDDLPRRRVIELLDYLAEREPHRGSRKG